MTILTINCEEPWFSLLEKGEKPVEGRKGKKKYRELRTGDKIHFQCTQSKKSFLATVEKVDCFNSLSDYLEEVTLEKALPGITSFEAAQQIYLQWSTIEEINALGFVGIWIKPDAI